MSNIRAAIRRFGIVSVLALGAIPVLAAAAFAQTADPLAGAGDSLFTDLTGYLTGTLVPAVVGLAVVGIAVGMLLKWGRKATKSA